MDFLFQGMVLGFDLAIHLGHLAAAFDDRLPELLPLLVLQPAVQQPSHQGAAISGSRGLLELRDEVGRQGVCAFDQSHDITSLPDQDTIPER